jgi:integrase
MTGDSDGTNGENDKIVRRALADGTVKEYRYKRLKKEPRKPEGDLRRLFNEYSVTPEFKRLCPEWQKRKLWLFRLIERELGWMTIEDLEGRDSRESFYELRDKFADLPHRADKMMQALSSTLAWAYDRGKISANHAARIKPLIDWKKSPHRDKEYSDEQHEILIDRLPDELRWPYLFAIYTGMRRGDLISLRWTDLGKDGWIMLRPGKTADTDLQVMIPTFALPPLKALLAEMPRRGEWMFLTETEKPWLDTHLSHCWRRKMIRLGMQGMRFHDTRHTAENLLARAGCTEAERAIITGRALAAGSGRAYLARSKELALNAYSKLSAYLEGKGRVVSLENALGKRGKRQAK